MFFLSRFIRVCVLSETSDQLFAVDQGLITESLKETKTHPGDFDIGRVLGFLASELVKCVISVKYERTETSLHSFSKCDNFSCKFRISWARIFGFIWFVLYLLSPISHPLYIGGFSTLTMLKYI